MSKIYDVDFEGPRKRTRDRVRLKLVDVACQIAQVDPEMAGWAIVAWDDRGACTTAIQSTREYGSPIHSSLVPDYVKSALASRITSDAAVDIIQGTVSPDDPA